MMSKQLLTEPDAIAAYRKAIMGTSIYRHPGDYMRVCNPHSGSNSILIIYILYSVVWTCINNMSSSVIAVSVQRNLLD